MVTSSINVEHGNVTSTKSVSYTHLIGPLTLRNRTIRSAAFESMCPGNAPSRQLKDYHCSVAAGGVDVYKRQGLSWTDMANLTKANLRTSFDGHLWIDTKMCIRDSNCC